MTDARRPANKVNAAKPPAGPPSTHQIESYSVKCGRCGVVFPTQDCRKLDHFSIYRVVCPHCGWPGRYLASELHAAKAGLNPRPSRSLKRLP